jgi:hypothetical protein
MRYFFHRGDPPHTRVLLIESGSRWLVENVLKHLRTQFGDEVEIDIVTCYAGTPAGYDARTTVYRVSDYPNKESRAQFVRQLKSRGYSSAGMICSGEPIMSKWKWMLFLRLPAKFFIMNENGDYFWVHRDNSEVIRRFTRARLGLVGEGALRTIARLLSFPFSLLYLILYALAVHTRRRLRMAFR